MSMASGHTALVAVCCVVGASALGAPAGVAEGPPGAAELRFLRHGEEVARLGLRALQGRCAAQRVEVDDPYYGRRKSFFALPGACVFESGFGAPAVAGENLFLRAADGYVRPTPSDTLRRGEVWFAFADADLTARPDADPVWEPIDRRQVPPGPFYLIWSGPGQSDPHRYPWPYQLVAVEIAPLESEYPHLDPHAPPHSPAVLGYHLFRDQCVSCHALNGDGGTVGPDLNVPRSIVEYRPVEQIRAYIRDPQSFRFTSMPAHRHLGEEDLDALVAYFRAMSKRKYIPGKRIPGERDRGEPVPETSP